MSLLCLELCTPGEVSIGTSWVTLVAGVGCLDRAAVGLGVEGVHIGFAPGTDLAAVALVNL